MDESGADGVADERLRTLFAAQQDIIVVGDARDGVEALEQVDALAPDVVVMDLVMPRMSGLEATARIRETHPEVKILIPSMYDDDEYVQRVIKAGASGYVLKGVASDELVSAIREVHSGSSFLQPAIAAKLIEDYVRRVRDDDTSPAVSVPGGASEGEGEPLTLREREVLTLIAEGGTNRVVANALGLSRKTVESHRANIMRKLGAHDVTAVRCR